MNWNVHDSDEQLLLGKSEEQKKEFYEFQERRKKEKQILDKAVVRVEGDREKSIKQLRTRIQAYGGRKARKSREDFPAPNERKREKRRTAYRRYIRRAK